MLLKLICFFIITLLSVHSVFAGEEKNSKNTLDFWTPEKIKDDKKLLIPELKSLLKKELSNQKHEKAIVHDDAPPIASTVATTGTGM